MDNLQPIRNREDHQAALTEIELLFDVSQGTPEFDRLEILVTLVEAYENKHEPILPPEPIEAILNQDNILDTIRQIRSQQTAFLSSEEIDRQMQVERDSWDS
jgi:antitoxin component HigA of HigAB toxin-antitoxin module